MYASVPSARFLFEIVPMMSVLQAFRVTVTDETGGQVFWAAKLVLQTGTLMP